MVAIERIYTSDEFWELAETFPEDKHYELWDGVIVEMPPPSKLHSKIAGIILTFLNMFVLENGFGTVLGEGGGYKLDEYNVRVPDVSFFAREADLTDNTAIFPPDLAVEVISPSETPRSIAEKTELYLNSGTKLVWNVYPDEQVIEVWRKNDATKLEMEPIRRDGTVTGGDMLPGFELPLSKVFPQS